MAISNIPIEELPDFGRRLMTLAREHDLGTPALLAEALYENSYDLVEPGNRTNKYGKKVKDKAHDIAAIKRMVQKHFNADSATQVQSQYLLAYSQLFQCSTDFLFGMTDVKSNNLDIREITEKLGLQEESVINLMTNATADEEAQSINSVWDSVLGSDYYNNIARELIFYSKECLTYKDLEENIKAKEKASESLEDQFAESLLQCKIGTLVNYMNIQKDKCSGAYLRLIRAIDKWIDEYRDKLTIEDHAEIRKEYYENEMKKWKLVERELYGNQLHNGKDATDDLKSEKCMIAN